MANFQLIRDLAEKRKITLREIADRVGISVDGIQKIMRKRSTSTKTIENIARILEVPVGIFFDGFESTGNYSIADNGSATSIYGNANVKKSINKNDNKDKEIEHLKALLEEKEKALQDKERTIQILMNK
ncbi:hypothetical protein EZS27_013491 [termite gut metagenome]|uniref:HTH cro/C1-type domain-containing protein n=1 Tax=termite gut metagenome TaxID=433724 RepID=A0A5J4RX36_9ZZZZ